MATLPGSITTPQPSPRPTSSPHSPLFSIDPNERTDLGTSGTLVECDEFAELSIRSSAPVTTASSARRPSSSNVDATNNIASRFALLAFTQAGSFKDSIKSGLALVDPSDAVKSPGGSSAGSPFPSGRKVMFDDSSGGHSSVGSAVNSMLVGQALDPRFSGSGRRLKLTKNQSTRLMAGGGIVPEKKSQRDILLSPVNDVRKAVTVEEEGSIMSKLSKGVSFMTKTSVVKPSAVAPAPAPGSPGGASPGGGKRRISGGKMKRKTTMVMSLKKVGSMFNASVFNKKKSMGEGKTVETMRNEKAAKLWQQMVWDHLPGSDSQLRRYARWKEDYSYFLRNHKGRVGHPFDEATLCVILNKRGDCRCKLSVMDAGPLDPFEYEVHCSTCLKRLPPFADQMVAMSKAIDSDPHGTNMAHRNALGLELEEEREMLGLQMKEIEMIKEDRASVAGERPQVKRIRKKRDSRSVRSSRSGFFGSGY